MRYKFFIFIILAFNYSSNSQVKHVLGIEAGYGNLVPNSQYSYPTEIKYKFETNANYILNYKLLCIKAQYGLMPSPNFGNIYRTFFLAGISTNLEKIISFHFLTGGGGYRFIHSYKKSDGTEIYHSTKVYPNINAGIFVKPFEKVNLLFSADCYFTSIWLRNSQSVGKFYTNTMYYSPIIIAGSVNYLFFRKNKSK